MIPTISRAGLDGAGSNSGVVADADADADADRPDISAKSCPGNGNGPLASSMTFEKYSP